MRCRYLLKWSERITKSGRVFKRIVDKASIAMVGNVAKVEHLKECGYVPCDGPLRANIWPLDSEPYGDGSRLKVAWVCSICSSTADFGLPNTVEDVIIFAEGVVAGMEEPGPKEKIEVGEVVIE